MKQSQLAAMHRLHRTSQAATSIELASIMLVLFVFIFLPLADFGSACLRISMLYGATHDAALNAARARTYNRAFDGQLSSRQIAASTLQRHLSSWKGITLQQFKTTVVETDCASNRSVVYDTGDQPVVLSHELNHATSVFEIQVSARASVAPLVPLNLGCLVPIDGLTRPFELTVSDRQYCENPFGLSF